MKGTGTCPKCGSREVVAAADIQNTGFGGGQFKAHHSVITYRNPDAGLLFRCKQESSVSAWVCTDCGYIEFYADEPQSLKVPKK